MNSIPGTHGKGEGEKLHKAEFSDSHMYAMALPPSIIIVREFSPLESVHLFSSASKFQFPSMSSPVRGWRDGSMVKSIGCSSRGPEFNTQHPATTCWLITICSGIHCPLLACRHAHKLSTYTERERERENEFFKQNRNTSRWGNRCSSVASMLA